MEVLALVIAGGVGLVTLLAYLSQRDHGKRILALEESREDERRRAEGRANISIKFKRKGSTSGGGTTTYKCDVAIQNAGPRQARELVITLDGQDPLDSPLYGRPAPPVIDPDTGFVMRLTAANPPDLPIEVEVCVQWTDDTGEISSQTARGRIAG